MWSAKGFRFENKLYLKRLTCYHSQLKWQHLPPSLLLQWIWASEAFEVSARSAPYIFLPYKLWSSGLTNWTPSVDSTCHLRPATITEWSTKITPSLKPNQSHWRVKVTITAFQPGMRAWRRISKSLPLVLLYSRASKSRAVWSLTLNTL